MSSEEKKELKIETVKDFAKQLLGELDPFSDRGLNYEEIKVLRDRYLELIEGGYDGPGLYRVS